MTVTPDETPATCLCGARTYEPDHDRWEKGTDGWWCLGCMLEVIQ
jgi:hypothetical protein